MIRRTHCAAAAVAFLFVMEAMDTASAAPRAFNFQNAEFMGREAGSAAARAFVSERLPAGITMRKAIARLRRADAYCHAPSKMDGVVDCEYSMLAHRAGGDLGEDWWSVRLTPGPDGNLGSAAFKRSHVGMGGN